MFKMLVLESDYTNLFVLTGYVNPSTYVNQLLMDDFSSDDKLDSVWDR